MNTKTEKIDMLNGPLAKKIFLFTLPIALSSMLQQLFNAADTSIVGYFDGANALAGVGTNGEIIALIVTLSSGLSIGVNILIAQHIGQKKTESIPEIIKTAILLAVFIGILGLFIGECITMPLLRLIRTPDDVITQAAIYLRIYLIGYPFLLLYDFASAVLRARGDSRYPFLVLTFSGLVNVVLNIFFVIILRTGVAGVAIATVLSTLLSAILVLKKLWKGDPVFHLSVLPFHINASYAGQILKTGIPSAIQGAVFCFANIFVQASVNRFGAVAIAGSTIAMNFEYFSYYIITAFGQTATTFVSQNYAAGQMKRCRHILWLCIAFSMLASLVTIEPVILFRNTFCGLFSSEQTVIANAGIRIMCILLYEPICNLYEIPAGVLRGCGHASIPAIMTILGTCLFRITWICTVFEQKKRLEVLYAAFPISWVLTIILIVGSYLIIKPLSKK